jgi:hypothetical protein
MASDVTNLSGLAIAVGTSRLALQASMPKHIFHRSKSKNICQERPIRDFGQSVASK